jgi:hypothetical protein
MKKSVFMIMLSLLSLTTYAQNDDGRLVVEGKTWTIFHYPFAKEYQYIYRMQLKGDTIISEVTYKKLYQDNTYVGALREDGDKVYYRENNSNEVCLYDFGLNVGDSFTDAGESENWIVISKENKEYFGQERMTLVLSYDNGPSIEWIRGIGSLSQPNCNVMLTGNYDNLVICTVNNDTIYKDLDMYNIVTDITSTKMSEEKNAAMYDIAGHKLSVKPEKGFYIKDKRKFLVK